MTAYAREVLNSPIGNICWELRSVNHRYLEVYFKLPEEIRDLEHGLREAVRKTLVRGKLDCVVKLESKALASTELDLNQQVLNNISAACNKISQSLHNPAAISALDLLKWPGVINSVEQNQTELSAHIMQSFKQALSKLITARNNEGLQLQQIIQQKLELIDMQVANLQQQLPNIIEQYRQKLSSRIAELQLNLDQNRLEQELVYLLQKSDISEEIDRLKIHILDFKQVVKTGEAVGRKLDFILQEMNREANTMASKSISSLSSTIALELKVLIDQIKEQVQNLE